MDTERDQGLRDSKEDRAPGTGRKKRKKAGTAHFLDAFFKPRSVAIIGLSRSAIDAPVSVLTTLKEFGYEGQIHVVNPSMTGIDGINVCSSLKEIPEPVDLAVISVERSRVPGVLQECADNGLGSAIVITQGFADADDEGRRLQEKIVTLSKERGLRILGPNTISVANAVERFTSSFIEVRRDNAPVGQVAQSGLFMMGHHLMGNDPAGFCLSIDIGNACDIGLVDVLEYYEHDDNVRVIQCHAEAIEDGRAFLAAASRISASKPVIALKAGMSVTGQAAVVSHTGAAAGAAEVYRAAFGKAGVVPAEDAEELRLLTKAFVTYRPPTGRRVAVMSFSGGANILAVDAIEKAGLTLATLSEPTKSDLQGLFPSWLSVDNPLDVWIPLSKDFQTAFPTILECLLRDEGVDGVFCIYCSYPRPKYELFDSSAHIAAMAGKHPEKPVLCWSYGLDIDGFTRDVEKDGTAMVFPSFDDAAKTFAKMADYAERRHRRRGPENRPVSDGRDADVEAVLERAAGSGQGYHFTEGFEVLRSCGLQLAPWRFAANADELATKAKELSYPLCLKIVSSEIVHKTDSGGIKLGIQDDAGLLARYGQLKDDVLARVPGAKISGVLIQEMAASGIEIMIGAKRDPNFGPCVVFGAGGIYTEIFEDYAIRLAPIREDEAYEMLEETKVSRILNGFRGEPPRHLAGVVDALLRVSRLVCTQPRIKEIDLNPLIVGETETVVVDTRIIL